MSVIWSPRAGKELQDIYEYVEARSPRGAIKVYTRIHEVVDFLEDNLYFGRPGYASGTRELVVTSTPYIVIYEVIGRDAHILRVVPPRLAPRPRLR